MLKTRGCHRDIESGSNIEAVDRYLMVNCTGTQHFSVPFHTRNLSGRNDYYLLYMNYGELKVSCKDGERLIHKGDFCIYSPHMPFSYGKDDNADMVYLWVHFTGYGAEELLKLSGFECGKIYSIGENSADSVTSCFAGIFDVFILDGKERDIDAAGRLMQLFSILMRYASGNMRRQRFSRSMEYISTHYADNISVSQLAELENVSCGRYNAIFRECFGMSPKEYITELRLHTAEDLLRRTDINIKEAAAMVGYDDQNYFSRIYAKKRGFNAKENKRK